MTIEGRPVLSDETYKNYSLEHLKTWILDALSCEATPKEIANCIMGCLREEKDYHKERINFINEVEKNLLNYDNVTEKDWTDFWNQPVDQEKSREYNLREAEYYNKRALLDAQQKTQTWPALQSWVLPVQQSVIDGVDEYYIELPNDLLEAADLKEGDQVDWIDRGDGSYLMRKV